jgi:hypothetical protein
MSTTVFLVQLWAVLWIRYDAQELGVFKSRLGGGALDMSVRGWTLCSMFLPVITVPSYILSARRKHIALEWLALAAHDAASAAEAEAATVAPAAAEQRGPGGWGAPEPQPVVPVPAQTSVAAATAPPQLSPDGFWWWDGTQWTPAAGMAVSPG